MVCRVGAQSCSISDRVVGKLTQTLCWPRRSRMLIARRVSGAPFSTSRAGRQGTMLVLTRKSNQSIMIGDDIEVSVLAIMGEKVRIGIQAPRDIPVFRKEVYLEIQQERVGEAKDAREEVDAALRGLGETA